MKTVAWLTLVYGLLVLGGGIFGFIKASSLPSLIMGSISGILLIISAIGMFKEIPFFLYMAIVVAGLLTLFFSYRFFSSWKFFPAGALGVISLTVLIDLLRFIAKKSS